MGNYSNSPAGICNTKEAEFIHIFFPDRNVKKPCYLPCDEARLGSHACLYTLVGFFFDSSDLSDLSHSSIELFLKVFLN